MWWTTVGTLADRNAQDAFDLIDSFDLWLSARLAEAYGAGKDLAFFDTELTAVGGGLMNGWAHVLLDPGCHPPLGETWTVYRLHPS
jgi:hypothetical protein